MTVSIDFSEIFKLADDIAAEVANARGKMEPAVARATERLYAQAVAAAPVDTGELRDSIFRDTSGLARRVASTVRQGFFQEYGTSVMPPQPWLMVFAFRAWADLEAEVFRVKWGI